MTTQLSVTVRGAEHGDADAVQALWEASDLSRASSDQWKTLAEGAASSILVAEHEGRVVGAAVATYDGWRAYVYHLAVSEDARCQGIGHALMASAEDFLRASGAGCIHLAVHEDNTEGLALAVGNGYLPEGERVLVKQAALA